MDIESMIAAIFKRPAIWYKRHKQHSNRIVVDKTWREVATELQIEENIIRKKWKYLRDKFSVECGKEMKMKSRSGDVSDSCPPSKWVFYQQLLFLKDIVTPRVSSGSLNSRALSLSNSTDIETDQHETEQVQIFSDPEHESSPQEDTSTISIERATHKRKRKTFDYQSKVLELKERRIQYLLNKPRRNADEDDSDLMFYKSLLSHVRMIPPEKKLHFQREIQAVVQKHAYGTSTPSAEERMPHYKRKWYGGSYTFSSPSPSTSREYGHATAHQPTKYMYHAL